MRRRGFTWQRGVLLAATSIVLLSCGLGDAAAMLPRAGYWELRIGRNGPLIRMKVFSSRRLLVVEGAGVVACPDGTRWRHSLMLTSAPISRRGTFDFARRTPPPPLDHPGYDWFRLRGHFGRWMTLSGSIGFRSTATGGLCRAPRDRRTVTGHWKANPKLSIQPSHPRLGTTIQIYGNHFLHRQKTWLRISTPIGPFYRYPIANRHGRFHLTLYLNPRWAPGAQAQKWNLFAFQGACLTTCFVSSPVLFFPVTP